LVVVAVVITLELAQSAVGLVDLAAAVVRMVYLIQRRAALELVVKDLLVALAAAHLATDPVAAAAQAQLVQMVQTR
jgi:Arc/MetJ family transcription regulator